MDATLKYTIAHTVRCAWVLNMARKPRPTATAPRVDNTSQVAACLRNTAPSTSSSSASDLR